MSQIIGGHTFVPLEKNIDDVKLNAITGGATITSELVSTQTQTTSTGSGDYFLLLQSGGTLAKILTSDLANSLGSSSGMVSAITSIRLRSFNAAGNPNFEVDARTAGAGFPGGGNFALDRWYHRRGGTMTFSVAGQQDASASPVLIPGTNFAISQNFFRFTLGTPQVSLGAGDGVWLQQNIEGPLLRELISDVHSISVLVRTSVAGLKFGIALADPTSAHSLTLLATVPSSNLWTLLTFPNLPVFVSGGTWNIKAGNNGYILLITLAAGSTYTSPANGVWQVGAYYGASGQSNFAASVTGSTFDIAFCQHEPGSQCTQLIDCSFGTNYDGPMGCLRYFYKSYDYETAVGSLTALGYKSFVAPAATTVAFGPVQYPKNMAKDPTTTLYNHSNGAANSVFDGNGTSHTGASVVQQGKTGFGHISFTTATAGPVQVWAHYVSDAGW